MPHTTTTPRSRSTRVVYRAAQVSFALILLAAASLKARVMLRPDVPVGWAAFRAWAGWVPIGMEWVLAVWLLTGTGGVWARRATMGILAAFVAVAGARLLLGESDCGCFGDVRVRPGVTLGLDVGALAVIGWFGRSATATVGPRGRSPVGRYLSAVAVAVAVAVPAAAVWPTAPAGGVVVVPDARSWRGRPFPLAGLVDDAATRDDVMRGDRTVILYDHSCATCRDYLRRLAGEAMTSPGVADVRVIDVSTDPPPAPEREGVPLTRIRLRPGVRYAGNVPMKVSLHNGVVETADRPD